MGRVDAESAQEFNGGINPWQLMVQGCVAVRGGAGAAAGEGRGAGEGGGQQRQSRGLANPGRHRQVPPAAPLPVRSRHRHRRRGRCLGPRRHGVQPRRQSHLVPPCPEGGCVRGVRGGVGGKDGDAARGGDGRGGGERGGGGLLSAAERAAGGHRDQLRRREGSGPPQRADSGRIGGRGHAAAAAGEAIRRARHGHVRRAQHGASAHPWGGRGAGLPQPAGRSVREPVRPKVPHRAQLRALRPARGLRPAPAPGRHSGGPHAHRGRPPRRAPHPRLGCPRLRLLPLPKFLHVRQPPGSAHHDAAHARRQSARRRRLLLPVAARRRRVGSQHDAPLLRQNHRLPNHTSTGQDEDMKLFFCTQRWNKHMNSFSFSSSIHSINSSL